MRKPTILISLGSGQDGWLSVDLSSLRFELETGNGQRAVETLHLSDLKTRLPKCAGLMADVLAEAVRSHSAGTY